ncbi:hypothetical protein SAMN05444581_1362 [Methylocapsa palsarum]|uniref:Uncharacterized protein n=1 Tax=Methylocapsa palsarum TaxID=1612308 RepID=A0A1I4D3P3_9HYPH|nr:hypothetical protein SAMN05444581_1362 [Methylocapsa palsarum]
MAQGPPLQHLPLDQTASLTVILRHIAGDGPPQPRWARILCLVSLPNFERNAILENRIVVRTSLPQLIHGKTGALGLEHAIDELRVT